MSVRKDSERRRNLAKSLDNDSAWSAIFGVVIIAGLALAALFFFINSGDNTPAGQTGSVEEPSRGTSTQARSP
jgi:hypothetical protein